MTAVYLAKASNSLYTHASTHMQVGLSLWAPHLQALIEELDMADHVQTHLVIMT